MRQRYAFQPGAAGKYVTPHRFDRIRNRHAAQIRAVLEKRRGQGRHHQLHHCSFDTLVIHKSGIVQSGRTPPPKDIEVAVIVQFIINRVAQFAGFHACSGFGGMRGIILLSVEKHLGAMRGNAVDVDVIKGNAVTVPGVPDQLISNHHRQTVRQRPLHLIRLADLAAAAIQQSIINLVRHILLLIEKKKTVLSDFDHLRCADAALFVGILRHLAQADGLAAFGDRRYIDILGGGVIVVIFRIIDHAAGDQIGAVGHRQTAHGDACPVISDRSGDVNHRHIAVGAIPAVVCKVGNIAQPHCHGTGICITVIHRNVSAALKREELVERVAGITQRVGLGKDIAVDRAGLHLIGDSEVGLVVLTVAMIIHLVRRADKQNPVILRKAQAAGVKRNIGVGIPERGGGQPLPAFVVFGDTDNLAFVRFIVIGLSRHHIIRILGAVKTAENRQFHIHAAAAEQVVIPVICFDVVAVVIIRPGCGRFKPQEIPVIADRQIGIHRTRPHGVILPTVVAGIAIGTVILQRIRRYLHTRHQKEECYKRQQQPFFVDFHWLTSLSYRQLK